MDTTLLIGNGLNLTLGDDSWSNIMQRIAEDRGILPLTKVSLPLEFERVMNIHINNHPELKNKQGAYSHAKSKLANNLIHKKLPPNAVHHSLKDIPVRNIITTNYDYLLEQAFESSFDSKTVPKALDATTSVCNDIHFYHPHGHANNTRSICLGYEHYVKNLKRIRKDVDRKRYLHDLRKDTGRDRWYDKFFTDNVYILGLNMSECEIDLWSLLTKRASLYYKSTIGVQAAIQNRIVYYDLLDDLSGSDDSQKSKQALLEGLHVEVCTKKMSEYVDRENYGAMDTQKQGAAKHDAYLKAYQSFIKMIQDDLKDTNKSDKPNASEMYSLASGM